MKEWYPKSENHPIPQGTNIYIYIFSNIKKGWFSVVKKCVWEKGTFSVFIYTLK